MTPRLLSLATAVPTHILKRQEVVARARRIFGARFPDIERMLPVYVNSGIETRYSCVPVDWYERSVGWAERNRLYLVHAVDLLEHATILCLERAGLHPADIDAVVAVSTSGLATPSLDALLMERLQLRRDLRRLPIFGLGCAGGVLGLARAAAMARAEPGTRVLFVVVELCGLTFRRDDASKSNVIASALFGDGAAAALICCEGDGPALTRWGEHTWPDSLGVMGWRIEEDGFGVLFSRDIPTLVRNHFRPALDGFLAGADLRIGDIDRFLCHPGGAKVVGALEEVLDLRTGTLEVERGVLRDYGNMSAATLMFVLERGLPQGGIPQRCLATALGPGFSAGFLVLDTP